MTRAYQPREKHAFRRKSPGRPKKMLATIASVCTQAELMDLMRKTYERAMAGEAASLLWILTQLPKLDSGFRLPPGIPRLTSLKACVDAISVIGEMVSDGVITVGESEKCLAVVNAIAHSRISILAKAAEKLDAELKTVIEHERQIDMQPALPAPSKAAPVWSPSGNGS